MSAKEFLNTITTATTVVDIGITKHGILGEITDLYEKAERNKKICKEMLHKIQIAEETIKILKLDGDETKIWSEKKYNELYSVTEEIKKFILEISRQRAIEKYIKADYIRKRASDLDEKFGSMVQLLKFSLMADLRARADDDNKNIQNFIAEHLKTGQATTNESPPIENSENSERQSKAFPELKVINYLRPKVLQAFQHNKRICKEILYKVEILKKTMKILKNYGSENVIFILPNLQRLVHKIQTFHSEISQQKGFYKYIRAISIKKVLIDQSKEFDSIIQLMEFFLMVDFAVRTVNNNKIIQDDIQELMKKGIITKTKLLPYYDFEEIGEESSSKESHNKKVKKFRRIMNDFVALQLVAGETSNEEAKNNIIKDQVTILRKIEQCHNIIQFFGFTTNDNKLFLVTEWAEYGNLREFYNEYGPLDVKVKLVFALDIAKGLNFLRAVKDIHCDIRAENILITHHQAAKIAIKAVTDVTKNHKTTLERVRYCAPENLEIFEITSQNKHDTKSEIYSFGILLWEIAEEKIPYADYNDIKVITKSVGKEKYREPFSPISLLPKEYQKIAQEAVNHDPSNRPSFTDIFTKLQDIYMKNGKLPSSSIFKLSEEEEKDIMIASPNFAEFNYMTVDEAAKQHKIYNGNKELAYKCFDTYADIGDMKAKYFKAYYIQQEYVEVANEKDQLVAELFKEVADSGEEYPEAQLYYGNCLMKGIGVKKNLKEAAIYFTRAAENGQVIGMFNAASLYFSGGAGKKDPILGEKYMKLAAYRQHTQAIEYCKKNNIQL